MRIIVAKQTMSGAGNPDFSGICSRRTFRNMDMYGFKRFILICPEIYPV